jgi:hypothetical protein
VAGDAGVPGEQAANASGKNDATHVFIIDGP